MKKVFYIFILMVFTSIMVIAGPPCRRGWHHGPPPPRGNSGIRLATDIIGLVGAGLDVLRPPVVYPAYVPPPPPAYPHPGYYGYGYGSTVIVMPPQQPAIVAAPPPKVTYVPVQGAVGIDGKQVYQKVVVPDDVSYVTLPQGNPGAVVIPNNPATTPIVINR